MVDDSSPEEISREIAARQAAEQALAASEERFRTLIERTADATALLAMDGTITYVSPSARHILGWTPEELLGTAAVDLVILEERDRITAVLAELARDPSKSLIVQCRVRHRDESVRWVESTATNMLSEPALNAIVVTFRDISERRREGETRERWAAIVHSSADAIVCSTLGGTIETWNPAAERLYGYSALEAIGQPLSILHCVERPQDIPGLLERIRSGEHVFGLEAVRRRKDGAEVQVSLALSPVSGQDGEIVSIVAIVHDITEAKAMGTRLLLADRMVSMGALAAGVAHEINNPLASTVANLAILQDEVRRLEKDLPKEVSEHLADLVRNASDGAERVRAIVRDLRRFSRPEESAPTVVDLGRVIESSVRLARGEIRHRARLLVDLGNVPVVHGNEGRLCQVVLNLLVNAAQSIPEGRVDDNEIRISTRIDGASRVVIIVSDTGAGIAEDLLGGIFDPFFTTKAVGVGTGLGLSICHSIVTALGGQITVESTVGKGTTFRVFLPAGSGLDVPATSPPPPPGPSPITRRGRVLIVDDEPLIVRALAQTLSLLHDIVTTTSAREALDRFHNGERFDAILCDLMMPEATGMDLYDELERIDPAISRRLVFMTGGVFTQRAQEFLDRIENVTLDKPFDMAKVVRVLAELVREPAHARPPAS